MTGSDSMRVHRLRSADARALRQLLAVFAAAFEDEATYRDAQPSAAYLTRLLAGDCFIAFVAEDAGRVVGGLTAYVLQKPEQERSEVYLYDLAVDFSAPASGYRHGSYRGAPSSR